MSGLGPVLWCSACSGLGFDELGDGWCRTCLGFGGFDRRTEQPASYPGALVEVGSLVTWRTSRGVTYGGIVAVLPKSEMDRHDELMGREPGAGWLEFGPLLHLECDDLTCSCHGNWPGHPDWKHSADACQLRPTSIEHAIHVGDLVMHTTGGYLGPVTAIEAWGGLRVRIDHPGGGDSIYQPHELRKAVTDDQLALF